MQTGISKGNTKIRKEHTMQILDHIRRNAPVSRTGICKDTGISKPTVTRVIEKLKADGLILETGYVDSASGRKPVHIELNPDAFYAIGVNVTLNSVYVTLVDLCMNIIISNKVDIRNLRSSDELLERISECTLMIMKDSGKPKDKLLGIGVGVPGLVDFDNGIIIDFGVRHSMYDIKIRDFLMAKTGLKTIVDNNANTRVLGELWYGYAEGYKDIVYVICSQGIGSGIISDGKILRGADNVSGEFGHMTVNIDGRECVCGKRGCLETYCSLEAFEQITKDKLVEASCEIPAMSYQDICGYARLGDEFFKSRLYDTANIFATGLANLIGIINPEMVILSGELFDESGFFLDNVLDLTKRNIFSPFAQDVLFKIRKVKDNLYTIGAAALILKEFFAANI